MDLRLAELMQSARNYVIEYGSVKPGENVVILAEAMANQALAEAYATAAREAGANVYVLLCKALDPEIGTRLYEHEIPQFVKDVLWHADVCINGLRSFIHPNDPWVNKPMVENGLRWIWGALTEDELASDYARFPAEIAFAMIRKDLEKIRRSKRIRVTCAKGTHLEADISQDAVAAGTGRTVYPRSMAKGSFMSPAPIIGFPHIIPNASGEVYFDLIELEEKKRDKPAKWVIENSWVVGVEGSGTEPWQRMIEEDKKASKFSEIMWAYNPKQNLKKIWPIYDAITRRSGVVHMAVGSPPSRARGDKETSSLHPLAHTHGLLLKPSVFVDDEPIIIDGHLCVLDDPEIHKLAEKYGSPREVLAEVSYPAENYVAG